MKALEQHINKTLALLQKYTKVDMRYLVKNGFWLGLQQAITIIAAFAFSVVMANFVSKTDYGSYRFFLSVFAVFLVFSLPGISIATITGVASKKIKSIWPMVASQVRFGLIGSFFALCVSGYYFLQGNLELAIIFLLAAPVVPLFDSLLLYESWLRGHKRFKKISLYRSLTQVIFTAVFSLFVIFFSEGIISMIFVYMVLFVFLRAFFFIKTFKTQKNIQNIFKPKMNKQEREIVLYGKHLSVMNGLSFLAMALDKVIVFHYLGAASLAVYAFALALPEQIKAAVKQLISVALPKYAEREYEEIKKTVLFRLLMVCGVVAVISIFYIIFSPLVYKIFFPEYIESIIYTQILGLMLVPNAGIFFLRTIFNAQKRTKEQYMFSIIYPTTQILFFVVGYFTFGLLGVVWSQVIVQTLGLLLMIFLMFWVSKK